MNYLFKLLSYLKYSMLLPFAALFTWFVAKLTTSCVYLYGVLRDYFISLAENPSFTQNNEQYTFLGYVVSNINNVLAKFDNLVWSLDMWFPMTFTIIIIAAFLLISIWFFVARVIIKLITVGQL